ncbi:P-loop containing nucleoside triphosphate hydrolase protein [Xylariomycetidae sp. FL2044]|nr:P-loop containing nucleoside triphosphate hydrolase protein [Xylariomycetidae sp. FL2044]
MGDPLSIAASVAGLLALSGKIYVVLSSLVSQANKAPQSTYDLLLSVTEMRTSLTSISQLIESFLDVLPARRSLVQLDHLIICLTQSVLTFSDLESFVGTWPEDIHSSLWKRWRWAGKEDKIIAFRDRIHHHKASIGLVLNILQCESDIEARRSNEALSLMIQRALAENTDLRKGISGLGFAVRSTAESVRSSVASAPSIIPDSGDTIRGGGSGEDEMDDDTDRDTLRGITSLQVPPHHHQYSKSWPLPSPPPAIATTGYAESRTAEPAGAPTSVTQAPLTRPFEIVLARSYVYARATRNECDISFTTNPSGSGLGSVLSRISLSQVSNISVIALPIWSSTIAKDSVLQSFFQPSTINIAVLGGSLVGKSTLAWRFCDGTFGSSGGVSSEGGANIIDEYVKSTFIDKWHCRVRTIVVSGMDVYDGLRREAVLEADALLLVYSLTDKLSLDDVRRQCHRIDALKRPMWEASKPIAIAATKSDLPEADAGVELDGQTLAKGLGCDFFTCSAKTGENSDRPFTELVRHVRKLRTPVGMRGEYQSDVISRSINILPAVTEENDIS